MSSEEHLSKDFKSVHDECGGTEGGACLWGHKERHTRKSCSYRYQAHERAKEDPSIYHRYKTVVRRAAISTSAFPTEKGGMFPAHYWSELEAPEDGDWDVTGPTRDVFRKSFANEAKKGKKKKKVLIPKGKNFYKDTWPYWNNAHHIIPKGTLVAKIDEETRTEPKIGLIIKKALLVAKYNVNHKINMMFLPQDREVAVILSIPRHLTLMHKDGPGGKAETADHSLYNARVAQKLKQIIDGYKAKAQKVAKKEHPELEANLDKAKLESLSRALYRLIKSFGTGKKAKAAGKSLTTLIKPKGK